MAALFITIFILALFVFTVVFFKYKSWKPEYIGKRGERRVCSTLDKLSDEYNILNDIMLRTKNGRTIQIDHIVVSPYGIFVIETKNYQGIIIGNGNADEWTQNIWGNEYTFYNPVRQNYAHIAVLKQILSVTTHHNIHNIVTFPNGTILNVFNISEYVVQNFNLCSTIEIYKDKVFSDQDIDNIISAIRKLDITDEESRVDHVSEVRQIQKRYDELVMSNICPRCGGSLVKREGKYGCFYGCSNYPKCRYTRNL
jgi:hypothetical protein